MSEVPGVIPTRDTDRTFIIRIEDYATSVFGVSAAEVQKLSRDPWEVAARAVQPVLWLLLFGHVMARVPGLSSGYASYLEFLSAGILAQSVLFVAIFCGISAIWERDLGLLHRYLVSPAPRSALVLGKAASTSIRGLLQAMIVCLVALLIGVDLNLNLFAMLGVVALVVLGSSLFATLSLIIACLVKTRERFMGIGQVLSMIIFFASSAIYPLDLMPRWLRAAAYVNPMTYEVDGLRVLMLRDATSVFGLPIDFTVLVVICAALVVIAARMYPRMAM